MLIVASDNDIFFPADKVFGRAEKIFKGPVTTVRIDRDNSLKVELEGQEKDSASILEFRYIYGIDEVE